MAVGPILRAGKAGLERGRSSPGTDKSSITEGIVGRFHKSVHFSCGDVTSTTGGGGDRDGYGGHRRRRKTSRSAIAYRRGGLWDGDPSGCGGGGGSDGIALRRIRRAAGGREIG
ncbi:hypothetical protein Vretimale_19122, partial [Volvox reticuliferus]